MKLEKLPFYWRLKNVADSAPLPEFLSFCFDYDARLQLLTQKRESGVLRFLREAYQQDSNIGYLQEENKIAQPYGEDFYKFIQRGLSSVGGRVRSVLEIGCGGCTVLRRLQLDGLDVVGVDPGPLACREGVKHGIPIIQDFYPSRAFTDIVDLIFHNDVLEHVEDPVGFLSLQRAQLADGGLLVVGVPDCSSCIASGDISMVMHQHLNYFDRHSLRNALYAAGFEVLTIERASYGGSLYALARAGSVSAPRSEGDRGAKFSMFLHRATASANYITKQIQNSFLSANSVGFYVPLRALPYLSLLSVWSGYRFFDDTSHWYGRHFDGVDVSIENFGDLSSEPVDIMFVMSSTFGDVITEKIRKSCIPVKAVVTLEDMLRHAKSS
jgi:SAM-dependent methyltransferase